VLKYRKKDEGNNPLTIIKLKEQRKTAMKCRVLEKC
jgi:hypothetical protein